MNSHPDITPFAARLEQCYPDAHMALKDAFAYGCYDCLTGNSRAGIKAVRKVLDSLRDFADQDYLNAILYSAEQNASVYGRKIGANWEIAKRFY